MPRFFKLPDLGEGVHEGEVIAVHVSVGQHVKEGDIILEVETDKAAVEIPSPFTGSVTEIQVQAGEIVKVGDIMIVFDDAESVQAAAPVQTGAPPLESPKSTSMTPVPASPATRRLARQLGVDLQQVTPTGHGGVVTADDVQAFAKKSGQTAAPPEAKPIPAESVPPAPPADEKAHPAEPAPSAPPPPRMPDFSSWGTVERIPMRSIRRATAKQMATAWAQIPHVNSQDTIDLTRLEEFRRNHRADIEAMGGRLTHTVFMIKAAAAALKAFPRFNASLDADAQEIIIKHYYHIGVAVNTVRGLVVPVIRDVDRKSIKELAVELHECVQRTRDRKISREELQGGTFTITNAGAMGGGFFTPIINYPQVAILGMGQGRMQPAVITERDGVHRVTPRLIMPVVLCIDHRVLDGADAIEFLRMLVATLQDPEELLMAMT
ncbi:MAG: 2-oxo acid dehydrogenase subunit E2 [Desulfobacteraceae bacterium]|nr:MAG: 2-oxo acid dehydrogenase subunit E2 [Desulfobacteraceae bacterium]